MNGFALGLALNAIYTSCSQISYASRSLTLSNRDKFPTLFRTLPSESVKNLARVAWIKHFKWQRIATIYEKANSYMVRLCIMAVRPGIISFSEAFFIG